MDEQRTALASDKPEQGCAVAEGLVAASLLAEGPVAESPTVDRLGAPRRPIRVAVCRAQEGVATLSITVILLVVALLAALIVGRVGVWEQQQAATDARSKEVYAAAVGGLEYAVNHLESLVRESHAVSAPHVFLDPQRWEAGFFGAGARLVVDAVTNSDWLPGGTALLADEEQPLYPIAMTADGYEYEWVYTALTPLDAPDEASPMMIEVAVTARAVGDSHVQKTVGMDVVVGFLPLFPWSEGLFYAPPLVVEDCISGEVEGHAAISLTDGPALATTQGGGPLPGCLPTAGFFECVPGQVNPEAACSPLTPARLGVSQPAGSLWSTVFGDIGRNDLKAVAERYPDRLLWVDDDASYAGWSAGEWQQNAGTVHSPVILFFDKSVGCPPITGHVQVHGIVYFEDDGCETHHWESGALHGTLALSGGLNDLGGNVQLMATEIDFSGDLADPRFGWTHALHYFPVPGSWRDFGFQ